MCDACMQKPSKGDGATSTATQPSARSSASGTSAQNTPAGLACLLHQHVSALSNGQRQLASTLSSELDSSAQQAAQPRQVEHGFSQQGMHCVLACACLLTLRWWPNKCRMLAKAVLHCRHAKQIPVLVVHAHAARLNVAEQTCRCPSSARALRGCCARAGGHGRRAGRPVGRAGALRACSSTALRGTTGH